ncbi:MAG TPA: ABC transporter permease [Bacillota bacterium]
MKFLRRFARNRAAVIGAVVIVLYVAVALAAPWIAPYDPTENDLMMRLKGPSAEHPLGNDELGRDILSRLIWGARTSLGIAVGAVGLALVIGVPLGVVAGYSGGRVDSLLSGLIDVLMSFPGILLALGIVAVFGFGLVNLTLAVGIYSIPLFARLARASAFSLRNMEYVEAARAIGEPRWRIMFRHLFPNLTGPLIVEATLRLATVVLTSSTLSFLGLGVQPPQPEWGAMIATSRQYLRVAPHATVIPGLALMLVVLAFNLAGDGLRDALDPTMTNRE